MLSVDGSIGDACGGGGGGSMDGVASDRCVGGGGRGGSKDGAVANGIGSRGAGRV